MKKLMIACCLLASGVWAKPEQVATAELASFTDISEKLKVLGTMINNPMVPTLLLGSSQQQLTQMYGRFRTDSPIYWQYYVDFEKFAKSRDRANGDFEVNKWIDSVIIYPSADGIAKMILNNPGTEKLDDDTLHITSGEKERWVKFSADGKYCSIAESVDFARCAIADFDAAAGMRNVRFNTKRPIGRVDILERGLKFIEEVSSVDDCANLNEAQKGKSGFKSWQRLLAFQEKRNKSQLSRRYSNATLLLDLNSDGLTSFCEFKAKPGVKASAIAGNGLSAGVLNDMTADTSLFFAGLTLFQGSFEWENEAAFNADKNEIADIIRNDFVADVKGCKELNKYSAALVEIAKSFADTVLTMEYPAVDDWVSMALDFNSEKHPSLRSRGKARNAAKLHENRIRLMDRVEAILEKQWPGTKIVTKNQSGHVVDWAAAIDVAVAESEEAKSPEMVKAVKNAKETLTQFLGSTSTEIAVKISGDNYEGHLAVPGFKRAAKPGVGEALVKAALPEIEKDRPGVVAYLPLYSIVRDIVLPTMANRASKEEAKQNRAMIAAMPPPGPNSAIATAGWVGKDNSLRVLLRITANEIKNYGMAVNAFTAASLSGASQDED